MNKRELTIAGAALLTLTGAVYKRIVSRQLIDEEPTKLKQIYKTYLLVQFKNPIF